MSKKDRLWKKAVAWQEREVRLSLVHAAGCVHRACMLGHLREYDWCDNDALGIPRSFRAPDPTRGLVKPSLDRLARKSGALRQWALRVEVDLAFERVAERNVERRSPCAWGYE